MQKKSSPPFLCGPFTFINMKSDSLSESGLIVTSQWHTVSAGHRCGGEQSLPVLQHCQSTDFKTLMLRLTIHTRHGMETELNNLVLTVT